MPNVKTFLASIFLQHFALGLIIPIIVVWQHSYGLSFTEIGFIQGIGFLVIILGEIPSSFVADIFGKKKTLMFGLTILALSFILLIFAYTFFQFLLVEVFQKLALAMLSGTEESYFHDLSLGGKKETTKLIGKMSIADETGTIAGMGALSLVTRIASIQHAFIIGFISVLLSLILVGTIKAQSNECLIDVKRDLRNILRLPRKILWIITIALLVSAFLALRGEIVFQASLKQVGLAIGTFGIVYMIAKLFSVLGSFLAHIMEDAWSTYSVVQIAIVLQVIGFLALLPEIWLSRILGLSLFFFAENVLRNVRSSFILCNVPSHLKTTALSMVSISTSVVLLFFQPAVGYFTDQKLVYAVILLISVKGLAIFLLPRKLINPLGEK